jgi:hypothetical protein
MLAQAGGKKVSSYKVKFVASEEKGFRIVDIDYDTTPADGQAAVVQK